ncbi:MAG: TonB-dependent receptor [Solimonas sp.]
MIAVRGPDRRLLPEAPWLALLCAALATPTWGAGPAGEDGCAMPPSAAQPSTVTTLAELIAALSERYPTAIATTAGRHCLRVDRRWLDARLRTRTPPADILREALAGSDLRVRTSALGIVVGVREPGDDAPATSADAASEVVVVARPPDADRLDRKREQNGVREVLTRDELADFADRNTAEAAARAAGVSLSRDGAAGRQISLRGLGPDFTRIELDGLEVLSTGSSIDARGSLNRTRSFDFNFFALRALDRIEIVKTRDAALGEGGIAGTVQLSTPRPLELGDQYRLEIEARDNDAAGGWRPAAQGLWSWRSANGRHGALLAAEYQSDHALEEGYSTVRWATGGWNLDNVQAAVSDQTRARLDSDGDDALFHPRFNRYDQYDRETTRGALVASWQFEPDARFSLATDAIWGRCWLDMQERHLDTPTLADSDLGDVVIRDLAVRGNDMVYGSFDHVDVRSELNLEKDRTDFWQLGVRARYALTPDWSVSAAAGSSRARFYSPLHDKIWFISPDRTFAYDLRGNANMAVNQYGFDLSDAQAWQVNRTAVRHEHVGNDYDQAQLQSRLRLVDTPHHESELLIGLSLVRYRHQGDTAQSYSYDDSGQSVAGLGTVARFSGLGVAGTPRAWLSPRPSALAALGVYDDTAAALVDTVYALDEQRRAVYAQWQQRWQRGPLTTRLDFGVRQVRTDTDATGWATVDDDSSKVEDRSHDARWLPSLNLQFDWTSGWVTRLSASGDLTRPAPSELRPSIDVDIDGQTIALGNPALRPYVARSTDLALERYFAEDAGLLSLALFHKRIDDYIQTRVATVTSDDLGRYLPDAVREALAQSAALPASFTVTRPENGGPVDFWGGELSAVLALPWLSSRWGRSQLEFGYTRVHGQADYRIDGARVRKDLLGLSKRSGNATYAWRATDYELLVTANWRSRYLSEVPSGNGNDEAGYRTALYIDAASRWRLSPALSLQFGVRNLGNAALAEFVDSSDRVYSYSKSGRDYYARLAYEWR